jgi:hypothetical protein
MPATISHGGPPLELAPRCLQVGTPDLLNRRE